MTSISVRDTMYENNVKEDFKVKDLEEKMKRWITPKALAACLTISYILSLIPLLWIGWYNYPSADDYTIGNNCRQAWLSTHNLFGVIWAGIVRAVEDWIEWMGYFTSNFLMAIPPSSFGERFYVLTVWIMLAMLSFSTIYLLKNIFVKVFHADKYVSHCVSMMVLLVTVQCMVGRVEAFYWYCGAVNYMFVHGMSLFFYGLLISAVYAKGKRRLTNFVAAALLGFFTGGGNQLTALNVAVVLLVAIGFISYKKKWKECRGFIFPIGLFFLGFILNVAAPGNWVRAEGASGMNPVKAVLVSFYYSLDYCLGEWLKWPIIVLVIILIPLFWNMAERTKYRFQYPIIVVFFGYCVVSAMMTPPLFAVGNIEAARLQALTFTMFILVLTLCVGYVIGWARKRMEEKAGTVKVTEPENGKFSVNEIWCIAGCILFIGLASVITVIPEPHYFTFSSAVTDLVNGNAQEYGAALEKRMEQYHSGEKNIIVEPLPCQPELLYFSDIKEDPEDWENRGICRFYGLDSVKVRGKE